MHKVIPYPIRSYSWEFYLDAFLNYFVSMGDGNDGKRWKKTYKNGQNWHWYSTTGPSDAFCTHKKSEWVTLLTVKELWINGYFTSYNVCSAHHHLFSLPIVMYIKNVLLNLYDWAPKIPPGDSCNIERRMSRICVLLISEMAVWKSSTSSWRSCLVH